MSFKFGLNVKKSSAPTKKKALLGDDDDDDDKSKANPPHVQEIRDFNFEDTVNTSASATRTFNKPKKGQPIAPPTRKPNGKADDPTAIGYSASALEAEKRAKEAEQADATIYDYDTAYDALHIVNAAKAAAEREDAIERKPKYMDSLFDAAAQRKKDQLRAKDKLLQREREAEGDEFADKEKFVTGAYKAQQEETRLAEAEEEKRRDAEEAKKRKFGMQGFHKQMLMEQEKRHQEVMDATAQALRDGVKLVVDNVEADPDAEAAKELRKQGRHVILDQEGQFADKRQLLTAGLNVVAKPKAASFTTTPKAKPNTTALPYLHQKGGRAAHRDRQTQIIAEQIESANKRKADEEAEEQTKLLHASKSQKTKEDISSAKERYLARKRVAEEAKQMAAK